VPAPTPQPLNRAQQRDRLRRQLLTLAREGGDGSLLPSERDLSERFQVARGTVRRALQALHDDGLLQRRQGSGTFAAGPQWVKPFVLRSFSEDMIERGLVPSSRLLGARQLTAGATLAQRLKVSPGAAVHELRRLRLANQEPMALETSFLAAGRLPGFDPQQLAQRSLYAVLEQQYGIVLRSAAQQIAATVLSEDEARLLEVPAFSPALLVERQVMSTAGEVVEYGKSLYRADRYRFEVNVARGPAGALQDGA
jgi:GntR family transcriptional regulator